MLRYINQFPFKVTIRHYFPLQAKAGYKETFPIETKESWDRLRETHPHFNIPNTREEWIKSLSLKKDGQDGGLVRRAMLLGEFLMDKGIRELHSVGVGTAALEYFLSSYVRIIASDFNLKGVARLKQVFTEATVRVFDIYTDAWGKEPVLFYRIDPSFSDKGWTAVFDRLHKEGVETVLYIPANFLTARYLFNERWINLKALLRGQRPSFAGYLRSKKTFLSFWEKTYHTEEVEFEGMKGFYLIRNPPLS